MKRMRKFYILEKKGLKKNKKYRHDELAWQREPQEKRNYNR